MAEGSEAYAHTCNGMRLLNM